MLYSHLSPTMEQTQAFFNTSSAPCSKGGRLALLICPGSSQDVGLFSAKTGSESVSCPVASNSETPWTVAHQAPLSVGFSRPEYWSGLLFPSPGDLPDPRFKLRFPALQVDCLSFALPRKCWERKLEIQESWTEANQGQGDLLKK